MRKMFSKNQIAAIAKNVVDNNEVIKNISYDPEDDSLNIECMLFLNYADITSLHITAPSELVFGDEDSLQDKLDEKSGKLYLHHISVNIDGVDDMIDMYILGAKATAYTIAELEAMNDNIAHYRTPQLLLESQGTIRALITCFFVNSQVKVEYQSSFTATSDSLISYIDMSDIVNPL